MLKANFWWQPTRLLQYYFFFSKCSTQNQHFVHKICQYQIVLKPIHFQHPINVTISPYFCHSFERPNLIWSHLRSSKPTTSPKHNFYFPIGHLLTFMYWAYSSQITSFIGPNFVVQSHFCHPLYSYSSQVSIFQLCFCPISNRYWKDPKQFLWTHLICV